MSETQGPTVRSLNLQPDLSNLAEGRRFVAQAAEVAGFPKDRVFDMTVASSEAIANAIEHSSIKAPVEVTTLLFDDKLQVRIEGAAEFQAPNRSRECSPRGLGLPLMAKLSDHLAVYSGPRGGTLVCMSFNRPGATSITQGYAAGAIQIGSPQRAPSSVLKAA